MSAWQPIETAPKDGTSILLYWPSYAYNFGDEGEQRIAIGYWVTNHRIVAAHHWGHLLEMSESYFHDTDEADDYGLALKEHAPTHWMALPEAPR